MSALSVHVVEVDGPAEEVAEQLASAGLTVSGPAPSSGTVEALAQAVREAPGADVVVVVGACAPKGAFPEALAALDARLLPGFGERVRQLAEPVLAVGAAGLRSEAGFVGEVLVAAVPSHSEVASAVVGQLLVPGLAVWMPDADPAPSTSVPQKSAAQPTRSVSVGATQPAVESAPSSDEEEPVATRGWLAAVRALDAEVHIGRREELPEPIEKLAPVVNVLHTAGEFGMLRLPSGRRYGLYGWPDLRRPGSKVLAVSWGEPLAEMVALHRHPHPVGTTIDGDLGLLPSASEDVEDAAVRATGRPPGSSEGKLFALESDTVWILRGRRVFKWDGRRERDDGNPKQVLASLTLHWSNH